VAIGATAVIAIVAAVTITHVYDAVLVREWEGPRARRAAAAAERRDRALAPGCEVNPHTLFNLNAQPPVEQRHRARWRSSALAGSYPTCCGWLAEAGATRQELGCSISSWRW
jgi:hypothetical protein